MKTLDLQKSDSFFVSESIKERIDADAFTRDPRKKALIPDQPKEFAEEAVYFWDSDSEGVNCPLAGWSELGITLEVPLSHLHKFYDVQDLDATVQIFDTLVPVVSTTAIKDEGVWLVTLALQQDN